MAWERARLARGLRCGYWSLRWTMRSKKTTKALPGHSNWPDPLHPTSTQSPTSHSDTLSRRSSMHPFTRPTSTVDHERMRSGKPTSVLVEDTPPLVLGSCHMWRRCPRLVRGVQARRRAWASAIGALGEGVKRGIIIWRQEDNQRCSQFVILPCARFPIH